MNNHTLPSGHLLANRYKIEKVLGQGGFGITYKAQHDVLGHWVCIKELYISGNNTRDANGEVNSVDLKGISFSGFVKRFIEEAKKISKFNHPNIVKVLDIFEDNNTAYLVMEFVNGKTLKEYVAERPILKFEEAQPIITQLLDAVEEVHQKGVLHRDIKPDNILIDQSGRVVLADFGSARDFEEGKTLTQTTMITPGYAPPEQYSNQAQRGAYTDIYSIGATLYFLLTKKVPIPVTDRISQEIKTPQELNPSLSNEVSNAILKAMEIKHQNRFQVIEEMKPFFNLSKKIEIEGGPVDKEPRIISLRENLNPLYNEQLFVGIISIVILFF